MGEFGRDVEVERDGLALLVDDRPAFARTLGEEHVVRADLLLDTLDHHGRLPVALQGLREDSRVGSRNRIRDERGALGEPLAEVAEVALGGDVDDVAGGGEGLDVDDVELLLDLVGEFVREVRVHCRRHEHARQRLADLDLRFRTGRAAELHDAPGDSHRLVELRIDQGLVELRPLREVHGSGALGIGRDEQILPHPLGDERRDRGHEPGHDGQRLVEGPERAGFARPETATRTTHVPVRQEVDVVRDQRSGALGVEIVECLGDVADQGVRCRDEPTVEDVTICNGRCLTRRRPIGRTRIQGLERDRVPVGDEPLANRLFDALVPDAPSHPRGAGAGHEPSNGVRPMAIHERDGFEDVAEVLRHLAAVVGEDVTEADDVLVRRLIEHERADGHQ